MANSENLFSKVFRGFSPDEVVAYIDELNAAHKNAKAECEARVNALTDELDSLKKAGEENTELKALADQKDAIIAEKDLEIERLTLDAENQRLAICEQSEKIGELEANIATLKSDLEAAGIKNAAMEQNSREYENMLADVESILSSSRRKAEELIAQAEKKAADIVANAESIAKEKAERLISESDEHLNENLKKVKYLYRRQDELAEIFREHKAKVDSFFASVSDVSDKR